MALALATPTVTQQWFDGKRLHIIGTIAIGASPLTYAPGGPVMDLTGVGILSSRIPEWAHIKGAAGFLYRYIKGATNKLGTVMIFAEGAVSANAPLLEHTTAAIVAGVSGDTIDFYLICKNR